MKLLAETYSRTGELHHAYVIEGKREVSESELLNFLSKKVGIETIGNPDYSFISYESFGIDEGRLLKEKQQQKAFVGKKIFVISTRGISIEAQNSLLKVFEEPTADTHIFLLIPSASVLLPTLLSRVYLARSTDVDDNLADAQKFIKVSLAERIKKVAKIVEEKDKGLASDFLYSLEKAVYEKGGDNMYAKLQSVIQAQNYLKDRSSSVKLLLEHLALTL